MRWIEASIQGGSHDEILEPDLGCGVDDGRGLSASLAAEVRV
jgi:hypothetical protein